MAFATFLVLFAFFVIPIVASDSFCKEKEKYETNDSYVNFVVVGATGSLAQKYLWQGMYDLREEIGRKYGGYEQSEKRLFIYGGARAEEVKGAKALKDILDNNVVYDDKDAMEKFKNSVKFVQLKTCSHYEALCRDIFDVKPLTEKEEEEEDSGGSCSADGGGGGGGGGDCSQEGTGSQFLHILKDGGHRKEAGRIFYLAVPPYSYAEVAQCLNRVCRPPDSNSWLRLVLEKPFGTNLDTVNSLVNSLKQDFIEDEIFLVDHYLGKPAVQNILSFRHENRHWLEPLLNGNHVEKIEIIIKEKEDVEGRLNYYDTYGVFLDVLQNHAMEMLSLVAMELPTKSRIEDSSTIRQHKLRFLQSILPIHPDHVVAGQYSDYVAHGRKEFDKNDFDSQIPTFGAAVVQVPTVRWRGVPMFLISGKALDAKLSLVRITFRNTLLSFSEQHLTNVHSKPATNGVISMYISSKHNKHPWISITNEILGKNSILTKWEEFNSSDVASNHKTFQFVGRDRAYSTVVSDVYAGKRDTFVGMEQLTASWRIWDEYLKVSKEAILKHYQRGAMDDLSVAWTPFGLRFVHADENVPSEPADIEEYLDLKLCHSKSVFVTVKPLNRLIETIVRDFWTEVTMSTGDTFNVAIPGGRTPVPIFRRLARDTSFPWHRIHFWFTDERCVQPNDVRSNYYNAVHHLLKHIDPTLSNVHQMNGGDLESGICHQADIRQNEANLEQHLGVNLSFDVIILGVGEDGHVASLFPEKETDSPSLKGDVECDNIAGLNNGGKMVTLTDAPDGNVVQKRMSLTFDTIAAAKKVFVIITGKNKHAVVKELQNGRKTSKYFPVKNVQALEEVRFYVDHDAYYG